MEDRQFVLVHIPKWKPLTSSDNLNLGHSHSLLNHICKFFLNHLFVPTLSRMPFINSRQQV